MALLDDVHPNEMFFLASACAPVNIFAEKTVILSIMEIVVTQ